MCYIRYVKRAGSKCLAGEHDYLGEFYLANKIKKNQMKPS